MGGCLPMLVQLPILWALYTLFAHAIELRHAPFIFWIQDLSARDPIYVTPILMTATMWLQQKMAPQAGDPQQQRIFRLMPHPPRAAPSARYISIRATRIWT